jgi:isopenicillin-N N-acyltransferase-like protein
LTLEIKRQIKVYDDMFHVTSKLDWPAVREVSKEYQATLKKLTPDIYEEIEGIAKGSGLDVLDIIALNCRSEIALGLFSDGCTCLGWDLKDDGVILAQNWDWTARVKENCVLMTIEQPGKPTIHQMTEAGLVGKIGFNSASVGVCMNAIRAHPTNSSKLPFHVATRVCMNSTSVEEAIATLKSLGSLASTQHILLADVNGPISCELSPNEDAYIKPDEQGIVCHTNHLIENKSVHEPPWLKGSPIRLDQCRKLTHELANGGKPVTASVLRSKVFSDTFNAPQAICCQEDPSRPYETRSSTLVCIAMKFAKGKDPSAELVWGQPGSGLEGDVLYLP